MTLQEAKEEVCRRGSQFHVSRIIDPVTMKFSWDVRPISNVGVDYGTGQAIRDLDQSKSAA